MGPKVAKARPSGDAYFKRGDMEDALSAYEAAAANGNASAKKRVDKTKARLGR